MLSASRTWVAFFASFERLRQHPVECRRGTATRQTTWPEVSNFQLSHSTCFRSGFHLEEIPSASNFQLGSPALDRDWRRWQCQAGELVLRHSQDLCDKFIKKVVKTFYVLKFNLSWVLTADTKSFLPVATSTWYLFYTPSQFLHIIIYIDSCISLI